MRRVLQTLLVHLFCILFFAFFYYYFSRHFDNNTQRSEYKTRLESAIDFFLFSTTIQAGVGVSDILPVSIYGKILMITQQLLMISINVITIYMFTA
jgi:hypothetical protein